jgi:hypothetical protein
VSKEEAVEEIRQMLESMSEEETVEAYWFLKENYDA